MNIKARIKAVGEKTGEIDRRGGVICKVKCEGCGKDIRSDHDLSDIEYVKTKRGSDLFMHKACVDQVWRGK